MQADKNAQMRYAAIKRLESLQAAGVLQIPKGRAKPIGNNALHAQGPEQPIEAADRVEAVKGARQADEVLIAQPDALMRKKSTGAAQGPISLFESTEPGQATTVDLSLDIIQKDVAACTKCAELASTRTQTVFGVGNPNPRLCFLGEAPGADEDRMGEPFVGRGGQLLNKIIEACRIKREDVYILNMIKCRPPGNRNPLPTELANCRGYLERQLDLLRPEFICCLGAVASQNLLNTTVSIGKLRGKVHNFRGIKVVCTYHPAFLLRSPSFKKETWEDMKLLFREMGVEL